MMFSRSSWVSGAAAAGSGIFVFALVVGLLDQILPTLPKVSLSLAGIPGLLAAIGASYGVWRLVQMGLQSHSWPDFRESLLAAVSPFDPADYGDNPRQPEEDSLPLQSVDEDPQTQIRDRQILDQAEQQTETETEVSEHTQVRLQGEQHQDQASQAKAQQLQPLQELSSPSSPSPESAKPTPEPELNQKLRQLQMQVATLKIELELQEIQLQQLEVRRTRLQQQKQKLKHVLRRTASENQRLRFLQEQKARQLEQTQQELQALRESYRALQVLQEISSTLTQNPSHERAETESSGSSD
ncbi:MULTISPECIES: hypothetical protein [unclassified Synechococcus]|uniref:hypothetical protein n=1 Tax=unclassified Synechococcus TaxID=2626047 RepID=UPI001E3A3514|nr:MULTISPECIES: hypothetical protein [unclassified Synechococcus]